MAIFKKFIKIKLGKTVREIEQRNFDRFFVKGWRAVDEKEIPKNSIYFNSSQTLVSSNEVEQAEEIKKLKEQLTEAKANKLSETPKATKSKKQMKV